MMSTEIMRLSGRIIVMQAFALGRRRNHIMWCDNCLENHPAEGRECEREAGLAGKCLPADWQAGDQASSA